MGGVKQGREESGRGRSQAGGGVKQGGGVRSQAGGGSRRSLASPEYHYWNLHCRESQYTARLSCCKVTILGTISRASAVQRYVGLPMAKTTPICTIG